MNETIETILNHRSIRKFQDEPLTEAQVHTLIQSAQSAATSSYIQAYSIVGVTDREKKKALAELAGGQSYVEHNGHFFVFCADLYRHAVLAEEKDVEITPALESTEKFMVTVVDAALAAQNAAIAAESMGLGICYIGGIRNDLEQVQQLLETPAYVVPLFGFAVGVPRDNASTKPRLPMTHIYHENTYDADRARVHEEIAAYDETIQAYYEERTGGARSDTWSEQMMRLLQKNSRSYMKDFVQNQGLNRR
ncbi:FMN reductase (NADPH) [Salsuginibacillus halophilus]|uniref:FMN reductase (NADPH) n=1 Tax=Salsuginibacillus halophilus TaxID=517424 RepID=A0A2P8HLK5_9BACI|nr:oxygen-insensitive NADPH nitroreductase [Salsuginibacillus halophilus]PSL47071.1 FMN reductase (NADPH) [Salsuginibacillus halophilus]